MPELRDVRLDAERPRGEVVFFAAVARFFLADLLAAAFLAGLLAATFLAGFLAAVRFVAFFAAFRAAGFLATFAAFAALGFFAVFVTFLAAFLAVFAVFLAAIGILLHAPRHPARCQLHRSQSLTGATDVARRILPRMVMVKEILAGPKPMYPM